MFVSKQTQILLAILVLCGVFYLYNNNSRSGPQLGENILVAIEPEEGKDQQNLNQHQTENEVNNEVVDNSPDALPSEQSTQMPITQTGSTTSAPTSEQPSSTPTKEPQDEQSHSGDSWDHVKGMEEVLNFVHSQCEKFLNVKVQDPLGELAKPRLLMITKNWREHPILYSSNPKSGSTSMKKFFTRVQGDERPYSEITNVHSGKKYGKITELKAEFAKRTGKQFPTFGEIIHGLDLYTVGFIRHPFVKLISGFRDKVLRRSGPGMNKGLMAKIMQAFPEISPQSSEADKFRGFVSLLHTGAIKNFHFNPQWDSMKICTFPYDFLGQTETTTQQIGIVLEHMNATQFEFPGSRSEQGYDSVATVALANELVLHF